MLKPVLWIELTHEPLYDRIITPINNVYRILIGMDVSQNNIQLYLRESILLPLSHDFCFFSVCVDVIKCKSAMLCVCWVIYDINTFNVLWKHKNLNVLQL